MKTQLDLKHRPSTLAEVKGHENVINVLANSIKLQKVPSSMLFIGNHGCGKTSTARVFAKSLLCETGPTETPCLECYNCKCIKENRFSDLIELDASELKISEIRELKAKAEFMPKFGESKVIIIDEIHAISSQGFQSLLKILEEPPKYLYFILCTTEVHKVPATIRSRCQQYKFSAIAPAVINQHLLDLAKIEGISIDASSAELITEMAEGSMRDAISILSAFVANKESVTEDNIRIRFNIPTRGQVNTLVKLIMSTHPDFFKTLTEIQLSGVDLIECYRAVIKTLRDMMVISVSKGDIENGGMISMMLTYLVHSNSLLYEQKLEPRIVFDAIIAQLFYRMVKFKNKS